LENIKVKFSLIYDFGAVAVIVVVGTAAIRDGSCSIAPQTSCFRAKKCSQIALDRYTHTLLMSAIFGR